MDLHLSMECYRGEEGCFSLFLLQLITLSLFEGVQRTHRPSMYDMAPDLACFHRVFGLNSEWRWMADILLPGRQLASHFPKHVENTDKIF